MFPKLLAGSVVALSIGQTYAAGYAWSGVNMGGFDFGCTTDVRPLARLVPASEKNAKRYIRARAISITSFPHCMNIMVKMAQAR